MASDVTLCIRMLVAKKKKKKIFTQAINKRDEKRKAIIADRHGRVKKVQSGCRREMASYRLHMDEEGEEWTRECILSPLRIASGLTPLGPTPLGLLVCTLTVISPYRTFFSPPLPMSSTIIRPPLSARIPVFIVPGFGIGWSCTPVQNYWVLPQLSFTYTISPPRLGFMILTIRGFGYGR